MKKHSRKAALYIRVSTQEQKTEGYGLENQRRRLLSHVNDNKALGLTTNEQSIYEDVHTGSERNREGLQKLIADVRADKYDVVLVWKIDRLSRSLKDLLEIFEELQKHKVSFISVEESIDFSGPIGNLIFQIFGAIAQFERSLIKNRTRAGKIQSALMGNYTGNSTPYGYETIPNPSGKGKKLEILPKEKEWVAKMFQWYIYEDMGYIQIAKRLNHLGVSRGSHNTKREKSKAWTDKHIRTIISQPLYRGEFVANNKGNDGELLPESEWIIVAVPSCVSETTFRIAQRKRETRKGATQSDHIYLLSGKIYDMTLDKPKKFIGKPRSKGGRSYRRPQFSDEHGEWKSVFEIPAEVIEKEVWRKVREALEEPEVFIKHHLDQQRMSKSYVQNLESELSALREKNMNLELSKVRIQDAYEKGLYDHKSLEQRLQENNKAITQNELDIQKVEGELSLIGFKDQEIQNLRQVASELQYRLEVLPRKQQRMLIDIFVDRVDMTRRELPSKTKRKKWDTKATVTFRFNPRLFNTYQQTGSTVDAILDKPKDPFAMKKDVSGGKGRGGYHFFRYAFRLELQTIYGVGNGITNTIYKMAAVPSYREVNLTIVH